MSTTPLAPPAAAPVATGGALCAELAAIAACPGCAQHPESCPLHPQTAPAIAARIVATMNLPGDRAAHTLAVGRRVSTLSARWGASPRTRALLIAAGTLHDIGYAVPHTGHHGIDGARWLAEHDAPDVIVNHVAWHSTAQAEADARGVDLRSWFERPDPTGHALLWVADFTTSPTGRPVSLTDRVADIVSRYPAEHPAIIALNATATDLAHAQARVAALNGGTR